MRSASFRHIDPLLLVLTCVATLLGLVFILDAGYPRSLQMERGYLPQEFKSQLMFLVPSVVAFLFASRVAPEKWYRASKVIWVASMLSLLAVELVGTKMNGAQRWLSLGPINVQPAEFVKLTSVLYLAACFAYRKEWDGTSRGWIDWLDRRLGPKLLRAMPAVWVLIAVVMIEMEPDLGTGAVVAATAFAMFIPGGVSWRSIVLSLCLAGVGATLLVMKEPYRLDRITNHGQRWSQNNVDDVAYQTVQSESAMAAGGLVGVGIGAGRAKHVMPATTTDFVMATVAEEFGLIGALGLLAVLGGIVWRLMDLAFRAASHFRMLVLFGVGAWIGVQTCVNVMMANGFLPAIGIPLPFISSGGSSLAALWLALGVCQAMLLPLPDREEQVESGSNRRGHGRTRVPGARRRRRVEPPRRESELPRVASGTRG